MTHHSTSFSGRRQPAARMAAGFHSTATTGGRLGRSSSGAKPWSTKPSHPFAAAGRGAEAASRIARSAIDQSRRLHIIHSHSSGIYKLGKARLPSRSKAHLIPAARPRGRSPARPRPPPTSASSAGSSLPAWRAHRPGHSPAAPPSLPLPQPRSPRCRRCSAWARCRCSPPARVTLAAPCAPASVAGGVGWLVALAGEAHRCMPPSMPSPRRNGPCRAAPKCRLGSHEAAPTRQQRSSAGGQQAAVQAAAATMKPARKRGKSRGAAGGGAAGGGGSAGAAPPRGARSRCAARWPPAPPGWRGPAQRRAPCGRAPPPPARASRSPRPHLRGGAATAADGPARWAGCWPGRPQTTAPCVRQQPGFALTQ